MFSQECFSTTWASSPSFTSMPSSEYIRFIVPKASARRSSLDQRLVPVVGVVGLLCLAHPLQIILRPPLREGVRVFVRWHPLSLHVQLLVPLVVPAPLAARVHGRGHHVPGVAHE